MHHAVRQKQGEQLKEVRALASGAGNKDHTAGYLPFREKLSACITLVLKKKKNSFKNKYQKYELRLIFLLLTQGRLHSGKAPQIQVEELFSQCRPSDIHIFQATCVPISTPPGS